MELLGISQKRLNTFQSPCKKLHALHRFDRFYLHCLVLCLLLEHISTRPQDFKVAKDHAFTPVAIFANIIQQIDSLMASAFFRLRQVFWRHFSDCQSRVDTELSGRGVQRINPYNTKHFSLKNVHGPLKALPRWELTKVQVTQKTTSEQPFLGWWKPSTNVFFA